MLTSDVGRIIFVVNCFGTFSQADENKIVETVRGRIGKYVMEKAKRSWARIPVSLRSIKER